MTEQVAQHYGKGGLLDRILGALVASGKDIHRLTIDDLAPIDEIRSRRRLATEELSPCWLPRPPSMPSTSVLGLAGRHAIWPRPTAAGSVGSI